MSSYNRKRSYSTTAQFKKPRLVAPPSTTYMGPVARQSMRVGGWASKASQGPEIKFVDTSQNAVGTLNTNFAAPAASNLINGLAEGVTATSRNGRKIVMKSVYVRWTFQLASTSIGGAAHRILVVYDKQANAALPLIGDILTSNDFNQTNNLSNRDRFVTIADVMVDPISANGEFARSGVIYKKINLETMFNATSGGTIADITTGSMFIIVAQSGTIATTASTFLARTRVRFTDA